MARAGSGRSWASFATAVPGRNTTQNRERDPVRATIVGGLITALAFVLLASPAAGRQNPSVAAAQVALRSQGLYTGSIDGVNGSDTVAAVRRLQRRASLSPTGVLDRLTREALGALGKPLVGTRTIGIGSLGWDVSVLEFELARHGFAPGKIDGRFDRSTLAAAQRFRSFAGLPYHCLVEPSTLRAVQNAKRPSSPVQLERPVRGRVVQKFGIRGNRLHAGIAIDAPYGLGVAAAADGRVVWADEVAGLGLVVRITHRRGTQSVYGHLSRIDAKLGQTVVRGAWLGLVGRTGNAAKPRLYFEVRVRGAAVDPLTALR